MNKIKYAMLFVWGKFLSIFHLQKILVWDMDGCLVNTYEHPDYLENLDKIKFFLDCNAYHNTIAALKVFRYLHPDCAFAICSKLMNNNHCEVEKDGWMNIYLPWIKIRMYVPHNVNKSEYLRKVVKSKRIFFFDDHSPNLFELLKSKVCYKLIKVKNQINCKKGSWNGAKLDGTTTDLLKMVNDLETIVYGRIITKRLPSKC